MKLFKNLKKGFTLIELVVVIAVIAILSAVSVVSYVAITNKAKASTDEQAVTQMNTILTANEVMDLRSIRDVIDAFAENGLDAEDYKPLMKDRYFFWDADANKIIYTDDEYNVLFPESLKGPKKENSHWLSLSGEINKRDYSENLSGNNLSLLGESATAAGEMLYKFSEDVKSGQNTMLKEEESKTITLPEKVDLAGSEFNLGEINQPLVIKGQDTQHKAEIQNFFTSEYQSKSASGNRKGRQYSAGLIQKVNNTVTFEDLIIDNVSIGDYDIHMSAVFAGSINKGGKLIIKNCTIRNAYVYGAAKVAIFAGTIQSDGELVIEKCKVENVHIVAEEGCAGGITGYCGSTAATPITVDSETVNSVKNEVTVELHKVSDRVYHTFPVSLTNASAECASTVYFDEDTKEKRGEFAKPGLAKYTSSDFKNGSAVTPEHTLRRFKPGCATFGWVADSSHPIIDGSNIVDYGLKPLAY